MTTKTTSPLPISSLKHSHPPDYRRAEQPPDVTLSCQTAERYIGNKYERGHSKGKTTMKVTAKKILVLVFFLLSTLSLLRQLSITATNTSSPTSPPGLPQTLRNTCSSMSSACTKSSSNRKHHKFPSTSNFTAKELQLISNVISSRAPCNLLIFGIGPQFLQLSLLNSGGTTIFLEDDTEKISTISSNYTGVRAYKIEHQRTAREAFKLLKHARGNPACSPKVGLLQASRCHLALTKLPKEVHKQKWDLVLVDGPSSDGLEAPGRMGAIYTAAVVARSGNITDVLVHDTDRTIEKWFSLEFLCEENLISSKGKLWHFRITGNSNSSSFCSNVTVQIV